MKKKREEEEEDVICYIVNMDINYERRNRNRYLKQPTHTLFNDHFKLLLGVIIDVSVFINSRKYHGTRTHESHLLTQPTACLYSKVL